MIKMNRILVFFCALFIGLAANAQSLSKDEINSDWTLVMSQDGIEFYAKTQECDLAPGKLPFEYAMLKVVNTTSENKYVTYNIAMHFEEGCSGCEESSETNYVVQLDANSSVEGDCNFEVRGLAGLMNNPNNPLNWHFTSISIEFLTVE